MHGVGSLEHFNPWIATQRPRQRAIRRIYRIDTSGATLQQTINEPTHVTAEISADSIGHVQSEMIERRGELITPAGHESA